jgi:hypothetical protein
MKKVQLKGLACLCLAGAPAGGQSIVLPLGPKCPAGHIGTERQVRHVAHSKGAAPKSDGRRTGVDWLLAR